MLQVATYKKTLRDWLTNENDGGVGFEIKFDMWPKNKEVQFYKCSIIVSKQSSFIMFFDNSPSSILNFLASSPINVNLPNIYASLVINIRAK